MIKDVLTAAQKTLLNIPGLKYVAEDWGQLDYYTNRPPVEFPCALIDVQGADYADLSRQYQQADATFTIRIADYRPVNVSALSQESDEESFYIFDLLAEIYKALQGLCGPTFSRISRTRLRKAERDDGIREMVMTFRFGFTDSSAAPKMQKATPDPRITAKID